MNQYQMQNSFSSQTDFEKINASRRSIDWRDSGIVIDEDDPLISFDRIDTDFNSTLSSCRLDSANSGCPLERLNSDKDDDGDTFLHLAVVGCTLSKVKDLIKICDLDAINNMMQTPLHVATMANRAEMVGALLESGAKWDVYDRRGNTPLHLACQKGSEGIVELILDFVAKTNSNITSKELLERTNFDGQSCLHLTALHNQQRVLKLLVSKYHVNLNFRDSKSGETIMHKAIKSYDVDLVCLILSFSEHCNARDFSGRLPLDTIKVLRGSLSDQSHLNKLDMIEKLVEGRNQLCKAQNGCCSGGIDEFARGLSDSSSSSDYSDTDSEPN